jgi:peptide subunit release factor RF-3
MLKYPQESYHKHKNKTTMKNTKLKQIINKLIKEVMSEDFPDIEAKNYPEALFNQMGMDDLDIIYDNLVDEYNEKEAIAQLATLLYNNMKNQDDIIEAIEKSKLNEEIKIALIDEVNDIFEEKNDLNRFDESYNRMKKLAGIVSENNFNSKNR